MQYRQCGGVMWLMVPKGPPKPVRPNYDKDGKFLGYIPMSVPHVTEGKPAQR